MDEQLVARGTIHVIRSVDLSHSDLWGGETKGRVNH